MNTLPMMPITGSPSNVYFILGCGRSGTTSLARIFDQASNGLCLNEPKPVMARESRLLAEGRLGTPFSVLQHNLLPRIISTLDRGLIYGEKNLTLGPFVPYLHALFRCRFAFVVKDGRDVVRSWIDWHDHLYGSVFRECREVGNLSRHAREWVARFPVPLDEYDGGRLRPQPGDAWYAPWENLSRLEMVSWYWARTNDLILDLLQSLPLDCWQMVDYSRISGARVMEIARFLGLSGLDSEEVSVRVDSRINSFEEQATGGVRFPPWAEWSDADKVAFDAIATPTMRRFGYYANESLRFKPERYDMTGIVSDTLELSGDDAIAWLKTRLNGAEPNDIIEAGCGSDRNIADAFARATIMGIDTSEARVMRRAGQASAQESYQQGDWITFDYESIQADLVTTRPNQLHQVYDIEAYIKGLAASSRRWVFLVFTPPPEKGLTEHRHRWNALDNRFSNDVSEAALTAQFRQAGFCIQTETLGSGAARRTMLLAQLAKDKVN